MALQLTQGQGLIVGQCLEHVSIHSPRIGHGQCNQLVYRAIGVFLALGRTYLLNQVCCLGLRLIVGNRVGFIHLGLEHLVGFLGLLHGRLQMLKALQIGIPFFQGDAFVLHKLGQKILVSITQTRGSQQGFILGDGPVDFFWIAQAALEAIALLTQCLHGGIGFGQVLLGLVWIGLAVAHQGSNGVLRGEALALVVQHLIDVASLDSRLRSLGHSLWLSRNRGIGSFGFGLLCRLIPQGTSLMSTTQRSGSVSCRSSPDHGTAVNVCGRRWGTCDFPFQICLITFRGGFRSSRTKSSLACVKQCLFQGCAGKLFLCGGGRILGLFSGKAQLTECLASTQRGGIPQVLCCPSQCGITCHLIELFLGRQSTVVLLGIVGDTLVEQIHGITSVCHTQGCWPCGATQHTYSHLRQVLQHMLQHRFLVTQDGTTRIAQQASNTSYLIPCVSVGDLFPIGCKSLLQIFLQLGLFGAIHHLRDVEGFIDVTHRLGRLERSSYLIPIGSSAL